VVCAGAGRGDGFAAGRGEGLTTGFGDVLGEGTAAGLGDSTTSEGVGSGEYDGEGEAASATMVGDGVAACFVGPATSPATPSPPQQRTRSPAIEAKTIQRTLLDFFGAGGSADGCDTEAPRGLTMNF
jgi:hypothetical protein